MSKPETTPEKPPADANADGPRTNPALPTGRPISPEGLRQVTLSPGKTIDEFGVSEPARAQERTSTPPEQQIDAYLGATIDGRYLVEKQLGEGGMGVVYLCRHTIIDKKVAMKVLRADMARNEEVTERFLNEARSASSIGNPHIIDISDFGQLPDGATYFVMEFLTGTPMAELAEAGEPLEPDRVGHIGIQLTQGLAAAHDAGIVHRDLKPDNIFLVRQGNQEDFVKILDFGIAKASTATTKLTHAGQVFGTPHYMSPEQAAGAVVDHRSDIYALGVILYELSTGMLPFDAENFMAILTQHMYKAPLPPSQVPGLPHKIPPGLEMIILKCMAKEPTDRFQTMAEVGHQLRQVFTGGLHISAREMRSIADGFASAEDFFARTGGRFSSVGQAPAVATRAQKIRSNLPLYAIIGTSAALLTGSVVWALASPRGSTSAESDLQQEALVGQQSPTDVKGLAAAEIPAAVPVVAKEAPKVRVAIAMAPLDAHVFNGETDLGENPVMVEVGDTPIELVVKKNGYESQKIVVDGKESVISVSLKKASAKPINQPGQTTRPPSSTKPKPKLGDDGLVNPWD